MPAETPTPTVDRPHVFLSYSWSSPDHQQRVKQLAEELTELNVHVLFDVWDLKTGDDTLKFMERSVNDPKVTKVLIVADKTYVEKANGRISGVGTETQIISPSIYGSTDPGKFALVVFERDDDGKPYLPAYYKSKMYIDFSDPTRHADEFDRLVRWIFDKPADVRPAYGATPAFVTEPDAVSLGADTQARRTLDALHTGKTTALGAWTEYLNTCATNLPRFRIVRSTDEEFDEQVMKSIEALKPFRDQLLGLVDAVAVHTESDEYGARLHKFFEDFYRLTQRPADATGGWHESDYDNLAFILHETFLLSCALLLKKNKFNLLNQVVAVDYYLPRPGYGSDPVASYCRFSASTLPSFITRKRRLASNRISLQADLLKDRLSGQLALEDLLQTDFLLFLRSKFLGEHWFPATFVYANFNRPFEVFARATSVAFFNRLKPVLGADSADAFKAFVGTLSGGYGEGLFAGSYRQLAGIDTLATRP